MSPVPAAVQAVLDEHRGVLDQCVATVEAAVTAMVSAGLDEDLRARAERDAHKLAGSLGMFGLPRGSEVAAELERSLGVAGGPAAAELPRLAELVLDLQNQLLGLLEQAAEDEPPDGQEPAAAGCDVVLVVTPDPELADRLMVEGPQRHRSQRGHVRQRAAARGRRGP